jgi:5'(3')-deoxyribonucleotidase
MRTPIFVDFDETLVNTVGAVLERFFIKTGIRLSTKDIKHWTWLSDTYGEEFAHFWVQPGLYDDVEPLPGAIEFIKELRKDWHPIVLTHSHSCVIEEKSRCIEKLFDLPYVHEIDKWKVTGTFPLIDDGPHNIKAQVENNAAPAVLFNLDNSRGWSTLDLVSPLMTKAYTYSEVLCQIEQFRK